MMIRIEGESEDVAAHFDAGFLDTLLGAVVARFANALKVFRVEEQRFITAMRLNVIADGGGNLTTRAGAEDAKRLTPELFEAESFPCCAVVKLNPGFHDAMIPSVMVIGFQTLQKTTIQAKK